MIISLGVDIIEKDRIKNIITNKKKIIKKILNKNEKISFIYTKNKIEKLTKIFSIKEAFVKAIGIGMKSTISFKKIIIKNNILGKPLIKNNNTYVSISHDKNILIAFVLIKIKN